MDHTRAQLAMETGEEVTAYDGSVVVIVEIDACDPYDDGTILARAAVSGPDSLYGRWFDILDLTAKEDL